MHPFQWSVAPALHVEGGEPFPALERAREESGSSDSPGSLLRSRRLEQAMKGEVSLCV